mmetsp:Transcript_17138/g.54041  ORF Transcript_17138/g.54041 Transcript_17138/m.54041 type:complete len:171 (-) Transcript_17138:149-661(-)
MGGGRPGLDGRWRHKKNPGIIEVIQDGHIHGPSGGVTKITVEGEDHFSIELKGSTYYAWRARDQLIWDDDDIWVLMQEPQAFDGQWTHQWQPDVTEVILGDTIHWPDGGATKIVARSKERFSIELQGRQYHAQRMGDRLLWDDGDIWILKQQDQCLSMCDCGAAGRRCLA